MVEKDLELQGWHRDKPLGRIRSDTYLRQIRWIVGDIC